MAGRERMAGGADVTLCGSLTVEGFLFLVIRGETGGVCGGGSWEECGVMW